MSRKFKKRTGLSSLRNRLVAEALQNAFPQHEINSSAVKRIAIFPKYRVAFNRIQKNANSTTMLILDCVQNGKISSIERSKDQVNPILKARLRGPIALSDYKLLLVTRSPYSRTLSAFLYKFQIEEFIKKHRDFEKTPSGFIEFLHWLQDGGLDKDAHWDLQTKSMILPFSYYTHVVKVENYDKLMTKFLTEIGASEHVPEIVKISHLGRPHGTDAAKKLEYFYDRKAKKIVSSLYEKDFLELQYPIE